MSRPRIGPVAGGLVRAIRAAAGPVVVEQADSTPWQAMLFTGERHRLALRLPDADTAARIASTVADWEFAIPHHIVADVAEVEADGAVLRFTALVLEE